MLHCRPAVGQAEGAQSKDAFPTLFPVGRSGSGFVDAAVAIAGRVLEPTPVFESYWRFAAERLRVYRHRLSGQPRPWTDDPIIGDYRFTNAYRAADRVSQYLIRNVIYRGSQDVDEVVFRILLFKFFNKVETWDLLRSELGTPTWRGYQFAEYEAPLNRVREVGAPLYSAAYVVPPPALGESTKYANHLRLIELMMSKGFADHVTEAQRFSDVYQRLVGYPSIGRFIGFQLAVDINYSEATAFSETDFVVAGPGARDGIRKCFGLVSAGIEEDVIRYVAEKQNDYFDALGLQFDGLFGRPLQLVDCQNLFCEVDKYARIAHPEVPGLSGRRRIKQRYRPNEMPLRPWFPPKWKLDHAASLR